MQCHYYPLGKPQTWQQCKYNHNILYIISLHEIKLAWYFNGDFIKSHKLSLYPTSNVPICRWNGFFCLILNLAITSDSS